MNTHMCPHTQTHGQRPGKAADEEGDGAALLGLLSETPASSSEEKSNAPLPYLVSKASLSMDGTSDLPGAVLFL